MSFDIFSFHAFWGCGYWDVFSSSSCFFIYISTCMQHGTRVIEKMLEVILMERRNNTLLWWISSQVRKHHSQMPDFCFYMPSSQLLQYSIYQLASEKNLQLFDCTSSPLSFAVSGNIHKQYFKIWTWKSFMCTLNRTAKLISWLEVRGLGLYI